MKKLIKTHENKNVDIKNDEVKEGAVPAYLMNRDNISSGKVLTNMIK